MAFRRKGPPPKQIVASAAYVSQESLVKLRRNIAWQRMAWDYYDTIGELRYSVGWLANACSRARLYVGEADPLGETVPKPVDDALALTTMEELKSGTSGYAEIINRMVIHLSVAGETYLVAYDDPLMGRVWSAVCNEELLVAGPQVKLWIDDQTQITLEEGKSAIIRVWRQHARKRWQADSPVRPLLADLAKLYALNAHVLACADSRLAGAGILVVPESATLPPAEQQAEGVLEDSFVDALMTAMVTPIANRDSAAAVVPFVVRVPDESAKAFQHITLATPFDAQVPVLTEMTLKKLAIGLDIPAEVMLGMEQTNHWTSWQIEESAVKLHVEPLLGIVCHALTEKFLKPALAGQPGKENLVVWYDTTELVLRPNKGPEALTLYQQGLVGGSVVRRENGFTESDAPTKAEQQEALLWDLAKSPATAPLVLPMMGFPEVAPPSPGPARPGVPGPAPSPDADEPSRPTRNPIPPEKERHALTAAPSTLVACANAGVMRALEIAGKRLQGRSDRSRTHNVDNWNLHTVLPCQRGQLDHVLDGAFDLLDATVTAPCVQRVCRAYTAQLLVTHTAHRIDALASVLASGGCLND